jgi:hypothetical protein
LWSGILFSLLLEEFTEYKPNQSFSDYFFEEKSIGIGVCRFDLRLFGEGYEKIVFIYLLIEDCGSDKQINNNLIFHKPNPYVSVYLCFVTLNPFSEYVFTISPMKTPPFINVVTPPQRVLTRCVIYF